MISEQGAAGLSIGTKHVFLHFVISLALSSFEDGTAILRSKVFDVTPLQSIMYKSKSGHISFFLLSPYVYVLSICVP